MIARIRFNRFNSFIIMTYQKAKKQKMNLKTSLQIKDNNKKFKRIFKRMCIEEMLMR